MNSILQLSRSNLRRFIINGTYLKPNNHHNLIKRKNFSSKDSNVKSNQNSNQPPKQTPESTTNNGRNVAIAGAVITSLLGGYYLLNSSKKSKAVTKADKKDVTPKLIDDLPEEIEYLIIGGGSSAFAALRSIRAIHSKSKVIMISNDNHYPYMRPPLSKEMWFAEPDLQKQLKFRQWNDKERSLFYAEDEFYFNLKQLNETETGGSCVIRGHEVVKIDPYDQFVILDNGQTLKYGKCLLATGAKPIKSKIEEEANEQVKSRILSFKGIDDFKKVHSLVEQNKSFALIGAEFVASELACSLTRKTKGDVVQIMESEGNLLSVLPDYLGEWTSKCLKSEGIKQLTSTQVKSTDFKNNQVILNLSNGEQVKTDYLIIDNGVKPNTDLAKTSGLEVCPLTGGYLVNSELQARTNLWVAGDVASYYDERLGRRLSTYHDNALITGRLAGENMSGRKKIFYHQPIIWSDLGPKVGFEGIGLIDSRLPTIAVFTKPEKEESSSDAKKDEPEDQLAVKLPNKADDFHKGVVFYLKEGVVVGILMWNIFSKTMLARRIINENKTYEDLSELAKLFELHKNDFEDLED